MKQLIIIYLISALIACAFGNIDLKCETKDDLINLCEQVAKILRDDLPKFKETIKNHPSWTPEQKAIADSCVVDLETFGKAKENLSAQIKADEITPEDGCKKAKELIMKLNQDMEKMEKLNT